MRVVASMLVVTALVAGCSDGADDSAPDVDGAAVTTDAAPVDSAAPAATADAETTTTVADTTTAVADTTTTVADTTTTEPIIEPSVTTEVVPLPDHVTEVQLPWWTADGTSLLMSVRSKEFDGMHLVRVDPDGSDFTCLTCDIAPGDPPLMKPIAFDDGQRVLLRVGNQTPFTNGDHAILECRPSVSRCDDAQLVPVAVPVDDLVVQPQREFRVAPGGERLGFTQMRINEIGDPVYVSMVADLARADDHYDLLDARAITSRGELKQFSRDGTEAYVSSFVEGPEAGNGDVLAVDLATGDERRITTYPDYDEPVEPSPDGAWFTVGSARTAELFEPIAAVRRPNVLGAAFSPLALYLFQTFRDELLEPWLISAAGEAAGEPGLLLNPGSLDEGWEGRMIPNWNADGRRVVFWEAASESTAGSADAGSRVVIAILDGIGEPGPTPEPARPDLSWAPPLANYSPPAESPESRPGEVSGSMEVIVDDDGETLTISTTYTDFSDDGEWILDGTERIENTGGPTGSMTYAADIDVSGDHVGFLSAVDVAGVPLETFSGRIESEVDGVRHVLDLG